MNLLLDRWILELLINHKSRSWYSTLQVGSRVIGEHSNPSPIICRIIRLVAKICPFALLSSLDGA